MIPIWGPYVLTIWVLVGLAHMVPIWVLHGTYGPHIAHIKPIWGPDEPRYFAIWVGYKGMGKG